MSRPRNVRQAQRQAPKRHPEIFDGILDALDRQGESECEEHDTGWHWPEQDASRTFPAFDKQEKRQ